MTTTFGAGDKLGFIADLSDGNLRRAIGLFIGSEEDFGVVALCSGVPENLVNLDTVDSAGNTLSVSLAKVPLGDPVGGPNGWQRYTRRQTFQPMPC
jgi:hypothetical protein